MLVACYCLKYSVKILFEIWKKRKKEVSYSDAGRTAKNKVGKKAK